MSFCRNSQLNGKAKVRNNLPPGNYFVEVDIGIRKQNSTNMRNKAAFI